MQTKNPAVARVFINSVDLKPTQRYPRPILKKNYTNSIGENHSLNQGKHLDYLSVKLALTFDNQTDIIVYIQYNRYGHSEVIFLRIIITNTSGIPIYEQIKEQIKEAILSDDICEGDMLPSIRQLARDLKISIITTTRAYSDLEQEGFIATIQGKGCFVLPKNSELVREQLLRKIEEGFSAAVSAGKTAKLSREDLLKMFELILEENCYE